MYCTSEDIQKQITTPTLIQLTSDESQDVVNETITFEAILYSSTLIDGYLRGRYNLPLDTPACLPALNGVPGAESSAPSSLCRQAAFPLLRIIAIDLSIYRLYGRRLQADMPDSILAQYKEAIKTLEKIQKGIIALQIETDEGSNVVETREYITNKTQSDRFFSHEVMSEY